MSDLEIKCVRCGAIITFGDFASNGPSKNDLAALAAGQIGWRVTFAGWQCPNHSPVGRAPTQARTHSPKRMSDSV
jgi:hypothetical protein